MARLARVILPNKYPHHIIQRGNRRQDVFFCEDDYLNYLVLMTNHVHLILTPSKNSNLSKAVTEMHRRYTRMINFRENWRGYLWQGRFLSYPMDREYLLKAAAYVEELNPVRAKIVESPWDLSLEHNVHAHIKGDDAQGVVVDAQKLLEICGDWKTYLKQSQLF